MAGRLIIGPRNSLTQLAWARQAERIFYGARAWDKSSPKVQILDHPHPRHFCHPKEDTETLRLLCIQTWLTFTNDGRSNGRAPLFLHLSSADSSCRFDFVTEGKTMTSQSTPTPGVIAIFCKFGRSAPRQLDNSARARAWNGAGVNLGVNALTPSRAWNGSEQHVILCAGN